MGIEDKVKELNEALERGDITKETYDREMELLKLDIEEDLFGVDTDEVEVGEIFSELLDENADTQETIEPVLESEPTPLASALEKFPKGEDGWSPLPPKEMKKAEKQLDKSRKALQRLVKKGKITQDQAKTKYFELKSEYGLAPPLEKSPELVPVATEAEEIAPPPPEEPVVEEELVEAEQEDESQEEPDVPEGTSCPACGNPFITEDSTKCEECGHNFFMCPECGSMVLEEDTSCQMCGVFFVTEESPLGVQALEESPPEVLAQEEAAAEPEVEETSVVEGPIEEEPDVPEPESEILDLEDIIELSDGPQDVDMDVIEKLDGELDDAIHLIEEDVMEEKAEETPPPPEEPDVEEEEIIEEEIIEEEIIDEVEVVEEVEMEEPVPRTSIDLSLPADIDYAGLQKILRAHAYSIGLLKAPKEMPKLQKRKVTEPKRVRDPVAEVKRKFFYPNIKHVQSFMVTTLLLVSIGFILQFSLLRQVWYDNFYLYNSYLMAITAIGVIVGFWILLKSTPEAPPKTYGSQKRKWVGISSGIIGLTTFGVLMMFGQQLTQFNIVLNIILIYSILGVVSMSPTLPKKELYKLAITVTGLLLIISVPIHEAFGPFQTDFRSIPWSLGNELLIIFGVIILAGGFASLRQKTSFLAIWLYGALVLFLIPFHETFNIIASASYEPWDHTIGMVGIIICAAGAVGFLVKKAQYDSMAKYLARGNDYFENSEFEPALENYEEALNLAIATDTSQHYATPWYSIANALARSGRPNEALTRYDIALSIGSIDELIWTNKGNALFQCKRLTESLKCYNMALKIHPDYYDAWYNKGMLEKTLGKLELADESMRKVIKLDTHNEKAWLALGQINSLLGNHDDALDILEEGRQIDPRDMNFWQAKAQVYWSQGNGKEAVRWLESILEYDEDYKPANLEMAKISYLREEYNNSMYYLDRIPESNPHDFQTTLLKAKVLLKMRRLDEAEMLLEEGIEVHGEKIELLSLQALAADLSLAELEEEEWAPGMKGISIEKSMFAYDSGKKDELTKVLEDVNEKSLDFMNTVRARNLASDLADKDRAVEIREKLEADFGEHIYQTLLVPVSLRIAKTRNLALATYKKVVGKSRGISDNTPIPMALKFYDHVISIYPDYLEAHKARVEAFIKLRRDKSALKYANAALEIFPDKIDLLNLKGEALLKLDIYEDAIACFEQCTAIKPSFVDAWLNLGNTYVKLGDFDNAIICFQNVLQFNPNHIPAIRNRNICMNAKTSRDTLDIMYRKLELEEDEVIIEEEVIEETIIEEEVIEESELDDDSQLDDIDIEDFSL